MKKIAVVNYSLFIILFGLVILLCVSAYMLWFEFPRGYVANRDLWVDIHKWGGLALLIVILLHVILHWRWIWQMTRYHILGMLRR